MISDSESSALTVQDKTADDKGELADSLTPSAILQLPGVIELVPQLAQFFRTQFGVLAKLRQQLLNSTQEIDPIQGAGKLNQILMDILRFETGCSSIEDGMGFLLHTTYGSSSHLRLFSETFHITQLLIDGHAPWRNFVLHSACDDVTELLKWYARRKHSLILLEEQAGLHSDDERLFGVRVLHDRCVSGEFGLEVVAGARLMQRANMPLWFKVLAGKSDDHTHNWTNQAGLGFSEQTRKHAIAGVLSFVPDQQRMIIDELRCFIPYAALERNPGTHELELRVLISDGHARDIVSKKISTNFVCGWEKAAIELSPAPHAMGLWQREAVTGTEILSVNCKTLKALDSIDFTSTIQVGFDLRLIGLEEQNITCTLRVLDKDMFELGSNLAESDLGLKLSISVDRAVMHAGSLLLSCALSTEQIDQAKFFELTLCSANKRVICGVLERIS